MNPCLGITAVQCTKSNTTETSQLYNLSAYKMANTQAPNCVHCMNV